MSIAPAPKAQTKELIGTKIANRFAVSEAQLHETLTKTVFKAAASPEQLRALMIVCDQYNLNPFTKEIYAYPDKGGITPVVSVDGWSRIMNEHPQFNGVEFIYSDDVVDVKGAKSPCHAWIECVVYRKDREHPVRAREYLDECYRPSGPWQSHPKRMLRHKALIQGCRLAFSFVGIYDEDEAERIREAQSTEKSSVVSVKVVNPSSSTGLSKEKQAEVDAKLDKLIVRLQRTGFDQYPAMCEWLSDIYRSNSEVESYALREFEARFNALADSSDDALDGELVD